MPRHFDPPCRHGPFQAWTCAAMVAIGILFALWAGLTLWAAGYVVAHDRPAALGRAAAALQHAADGL